jgi:hypothetical protein
MEEVSVKNKNGYPIYLMFQDEARFGRMCDPRACWAPAPDRPLVNLALVREYELELFAPKQGTLTTCLHQI